jgi:hypothetical protein
MTGAFGILLALVAGWMVSQRRGMVVAVIVPFLGILAAQTWYIDSGHASSPPSTVQGTAMIGYYLVQVIILGLALGAANQLRIRRNRTRSRAGEHPWSAVTALVVNAVVAVVLVGADLSIALGLEHGTHAHPAQGTPPAIGILGVLLSAVAFVGLAMANRRDRRAEVDGLTAPAPATSPLAP